MWRKYPRGKGLPDPTGERAQRSLSYRLSKNSLFCADGVSGGFLLLTDLSPLRAKIHRFLAGIKKILFLATLATPAPASQTRRSKVASRNSWGRGAS